MMPDLSDYRPRNNVRIRRHRPWLRALGWFTLGALVGFLAGLAWLIRGPIMGRMTAPYYVRDILFLIAAVLAGGLAGLLAAEIRLRKHENGVVLVETALVLPVLVLCLVGITDVGSLLIDRHILDSSCVSAARYGTTKDLTGSYPTLAEVEADARTHASRLVSFGHDLPVVAVDLPDGCQTAGCRLEVSIAWTFRGILAVETLGLNANWYERY